MSSELFFEQLPIAPHFSGIHDPSLFTPLPDDWSVAVSDVKDSTGIIQRGGYKEVNLVGASSIIALLNLRKSFSLPFIFGGDGAAVCIPPSLVDQAASSLLATQKMASELYGIHLRTGIVPLRYIRDHGFNVLVARLRLSDTYAPAAFSGGGLQFAEECIKDTRTANLFEISEKDVVPQADFTGLECRWKNVPGAHGEVVSLIVQALGSSEAERNEAYRDIIQIIERIYGDDQNSHPVQEKNLAMSLQEKHLYGESGIRSSGKGKAFRIWYWFKIRYAVLLGFLLMKFSISTKHTEWGKYKERLIANSDVKKFDDKVRQVLSGTPQQREDLVRNLESRFQKRELVYGIHVAANALITCLIFDYNESHVHLVDAENGGYAIAAVKLKERLKSIK